MVFQPLCNFLLFQFSSNSRFVHRKNSWALLQNYACKLIWCMRNLCNFYEICQFIIVPNALFQLQFGHAIQSFSQLKNQNESIKSREICGKNPQSSSILVSPLQWWKIWGNVTHHDSIGLDDHLNAMNEGLWMTFWTDSVDGNFDDSDMKLFYNFI